MKTTFVIALMVYASSTQANCLLNHPAPFSGETSRTLLPNVQAGPIPIFATPDTYRSDLDQFDFEIVPVAVNGAAPAFLSGRLNSRNSGEDIGAPDAYYGPVFSTHGSKREVNGDTIYSFREESQVDEEPQYGRVAGLAVTETKIHVVNGMVTSITLTAPIFKLWGIEEHAHIVAFTGKNQTLCIQN